MSKSLSDNSAFNSLFSFSICEFETRIKHLNQLLLATVTAYLAWVSNTSITYRNRFTEVVHYYKTDHKWCIIIYYTHKLCTKTVKDDWLQIDLILNTVYTGCIVIKISTYILLITNVLRKWRWCS